MAQHNKLSQAFGKLSIAFQLQLCLILCYILLCLILILITYYQLDWLRDVVITESEDYLQDNMHRQLKAESYLKAQYIEEVLNNSKDTVDTLVSLELICINQDYFVKTQVAQDTEVGQGETEYQYGVSMRQEGFNGVGGKSELKISPLGTILNGIYNQDFLYLQSGISSQVSLVYPGFYFEDREYQYQLRQWYYNLTKSNYVVTEPHFDEIFEDQAVFSISKMVDGDDDAAVQLKVKLDQVFQPIFLNSGDRYEQKYILVSKEGFVLSISEDWAGKSGVIMKIYNETIGLSKSNWNDIKSAGDGEEVLKFTRPSNPYSVKDSTSGENFYLTKASLTFKSYSYYLLICYKYKDVNSQVDDIRDNFKVTFETIFYVILIIGIITVIIIFIIIKLAIRGLISKFMCFQETLENLYSRALYKDSAQYINLNDLVVKPDMFAGTISAFEERINKLRSKEEQNAAFFKKKIKPQETYLYNDWRNSQYPRNSFKKQSVPLQDAIKSVKRQQNYY